MDQSIKLNVLKQLPAGKFLEMKKIKNMDGDEVEAVLLLVPDIGFLRKSWFSVETGEYLSEEISGDSEKFCRSPIY